MRPSPCLNLPAPTGELTRVHSTVIISIIRIRYLELFEDFPWKNVDSAVWSVGELTSAITYACLPTLRPLVTHYFPGLLSSVGRSNRGYTNASASAGTEGAAALESGLGGAHGAMGSGHAKAADDGSASMTGSEVELAQTASPGLRSNAFEVHVVREVHVVSEVRMGEERGSTSPGEYGVRGYVSPVGRRV